MELLELKSIWKKTTTKEFAGKGMTENKIKELIKKKSKTAISKIKREMKFKIWFMGATGIMCIAFSPILLFLDNDKLPLAKILSPIEVFFIYVLMGIVIFVFSRRIKNTHDKINVYLESSKDLKISIEEILKLMDKIVKLAITIGGIITPILIGWILYAFLYKDKAFALDLRIIYLLAITFIDHKVLSFLEAKVQHKKYGAYIKALKECLKELKTVEKETE